MRLLPLFVLFFLALPSLAQTPPELAATAEANIDSAYRAAGPSLGCLLYEPEVVLTVAGWQANCSLRPDKLGPIDQPAVVAANTVLEKSGVRLLLRDRDIDIQSLNGLQRRTSASKLDWVTPFQASAGWLGYEEWVEGQRARLDSQGKSNSYTLVSILLRGGPDAAVLASEKMSKSRIDYARAVTAQLAWTDILEGEQSSFRLLPEDASLPEVAAALAQADHILACFYQSPSVRARMQEPAFIAGRKERRTGFISSSGERWLRGEDLRSAFYITSFDKFRAERLLLAHQADLTKLVEQGAGPTEWYPALGAWAAQDGSAIDLHSLPLIDWIWYGAYPGSAARSAIYTSVRQAKPALISALAADKMRYWKEQAEKATTPAPADAFVLFSHPDIKAYFPTLPAAEQQEIMSLLEGMSFDVELRQLLATPPYAR